jgi:hypothetical protein
MRRAKSCGNDCFVLTYESLDDPARDEVAEVLHGLEPLQAEEVLPGTIRVQGDRESVERAASALPHWTLAPEGRLSNAPPRKSLIK